MTETPAQWPRAARAVAWAMLFAGAIVRVCRWGHWRSLWVDEIYLADNIVSRNLHDLLWTPLTGWQAAPPGFLVLERFASAIFGNGERALRLVPLLAGIASLPMFLFLARRLLPWRGGLWAITLFVFFGPLIYYSQEVKPYSCDVMATLAISLAAMRLIERENGPRRIQAACIGAICAFLSYPAAFVLIGWILLAMLRKGRRVMGFVWLAALALEYFFFVRPFLGTGGHEHVAEYWRGRDAFFSGGIMRLVPWIVGRIRSIVADPGAWTGYPDAAVVLFLIGIAMAVRRRFFPAVLSPFVIAILAAMIGVYPFAERLTLFAAPLAMLVMGAGIDALCTSAAGVIGAAVLSGLILLPPIGLAGFHLLHPPGREETLPAYQWIARQWRAGDAIYLSHFAEASFRHYEPQAGWPGEPDVLVQPLLNDPAAILADTRRLPRQKRVWAILVHTDDWPQNLTQLALDETGRASESYSAEGVRVYLYDFGGPP